LCALWGNKGATRSPDKVIFEILLENYASTGWYDALNYLLLILQK